MGDVKQDSWFNHGQSTSFYEATLIRGEALLNTAQIQLVLVDIQDNAGTSRCAMFSPMHTRTKESQSV